MGAHEAHGMGVARFGGGVWPEGEGETGFGKAVEDAIEGLS
jgi:hypothetical protein